VISDLDIWRAANLLIREHGADADREAAHLQDLMLDRGDDEEAARTGADQASGRGAAGAAIEQAKLKRRGASVVRETSDPLLDLAIETWPWVLDRLARAAPSKPAARRLAARQQRADM
jgi:hypothetical protein